MRQKYLDHGMNLMEKTQAKPSPRTILKKECTRTLNEDVDM